MAAELGLTEKLIKAQSIDLVETFGNNINNLLTMLGVHDEIIMPIGSTLKTYKSTVTLKDGKAVKKGDIIPLSEVEIEPGEEYELKYRKHRKAVAAEDVQKYGFEQAMNRTDRLLIRELQGEILDDFFGNLKTGTGQAQATGLQGAIAQSWGQVQVAFEDDDVDTICFVNPLDIADYLESAQISIQSQFGLSYVENFLGARVIIISTRVEKGTLFATAPQNLKFARAKVNGGEIGKMGFGFVTDETDIIGVAKDVNKQRLTGETITLSSGVLFAERLDGIIKTTIAADTTGKVEA